MSVFIWLWQYRSVAFRDGPQHPRGLLGWKWKPPFCRSVKRWQRTRKRIIESPCRISPGFAVLTLTEADCRCCSIHKSASPREPITRADSSANHYLRGGIDKLSKDLLMARHTTRYGRDLHAQASSSLLLGERRGICLLTHYTNIFLCYHVSQYSCRWVFANWPCIMAKYRGYRTVLWRRSSQASCPAPVALN